MPSKMINSDERLNFKTTFINQRKCQDFNKEQTLEYHVVLATKKALSRKQFKKPVALQSFQAHCKRLLTFTHRTRL